jgi:hypothetical protein
MWGWGLAGGGLAPVVWTSRGRRRPISVVFLTTEEKDTVGGVWAWG